MEKSDQKNETIERCETSDIAKEVIAQDVRLAKNCVVNLHLRDKHIKVPSKISKASR